MKRRRLLVPVTKGHMPLCVNAWNHHENLNFVQHQQQWQRRQLHWLKNMHTKAKHMLPYCFFFIFDERALDWTGHKYGSSVYPCKWVTMVSISLVIFFLLFRCVSAWVYVREQKSPSQFTNVHATFFMFISHQFRELLCSNKNVFHCISL